MHVKRPTNACKEIYESRLTDERLLQQTELLSENGHCNCNAGVCAHADRIQNAKSIRNMRVGIHCGPLAGIIHTYADVC